MFSDNVSSNEDLTVTKVSSAIEVSSDKVSHIELEANAQYCTPWVNILNSYQPGGYEYIVTNHNADIIATSFNSLIPGSSINSGHNWNTSISLPLSNWNGLTISSTGQDILAFYSNQSIYLNNNYGQDYWIILGDLSSFGDIISDTAISGNSEYILVLTNKGIWTNKIPNTYDFTILAMDIYNKISVDYTNQYISIYMKL
jgi:hypothetical protein